MNAVLPNPRQFQVNLIFRVLHPLIPWVLIPHLEIIWENLPVAYLIKPIQLQTDK